MSASTHSKEEVCRLWDLLSQIMTARGSTEELTGQINEMIWHSEFQRRGKKEICGGLMRRYGGLLHRYYGELYDADDLFNEACTMMFEKVIKSEDTLSSEKTRCEDDFFGWFSVLTRNIVFGKLRKYKALRDELFFVSIEDLSLADQRTQSKLERDRKQVLEFIETLPENRVRAVRLWYEGYSTREIAEILGHVCSHVTIKNWVSAALEAFRKTIDRGDDDE